MKIGLISACYQPVTNGVTQMVALYKKYLEELGHQIFVFTLGRRPVEFSDPSTIWSPGLPLGATGYYLAARYRSDAQTLISQLDILHCHHPIMALEFAIRYGKSPIVFTNHTRYDLYLQSYSGLPGAIAENILRLLWGRMAGMADFIISPAESNRQILLEFGVNKPIWVVPNGIEIERFHQPIHTLQKTDLGIPDSSTLLVFCGRMAVEKNLHGLLNAFRLAAQNDDRLQLLLIGSGPEEEKLQKFAHDLGVADRVHFQGEVANNRLPAYLHAADMFVTASLSEVLPLSIIEAMAAGLPVVAMASPGIDDLVVDGQTGVKAGQKPSELAHKIAILSRDVGLRRQLAGGAIKASFSYDIRRTVSRTVGLYQEILDRRPRQQTVYDNIWGRRGG